MGFELAFYLNMACAKLALVAGDKLDAMACARAALANANKARCAKRRGLALRVLHALRLSAAEA
jgi:hypothetical protein